MQKPTLVTNIEIHLPDDMPKEKANELAQEMMRRIREKNEREIREYEIYEQGRRDGQSGILGIFGL